MIVGLVGRAGAEPPPAADVGEAPWGVANPVGEPALVAPPPTRLAEPPHRLVEQRVELDVDPGAARRRIALWTALGGASFVLASLQVSLYERTQYDAALGPDHKANTLAEHDAANHAADIARWVGTPLFLVGAAALGTSLYLALSAPRGEHVHKTIWVPAVGGDQVGVAINGRF